MKLPVGLLEIQFCIETWFQSAGNTVLYFQNCGNHLKVMKWFHHLKPLKILQKKVVKIITKQHFLAHTNDLFFQTKILKFDDIHKMLLCQYVFKNRASLPLRNHNYSTRNSDNVLPRFQRLTITQHSIFFAAPIAWNSIPSYLKDIDGFGSFKKQLKKFLVDQYV